MDQIEEEHKIIQLEIKYTTEIHKNVPIDLNGTVLKFQETLQELLKVPIEKQKIMIKGSLLKKDQDLSKLNLKNGQQIMVMGAREEHLLNLKQGKKIFEEDLTPEQKAILLKEKAGIVLPIGLVNLGNTCYMNASIQILRRVNELNEYLKNNAKQGQGPSVKFFNALKDVFQKLELKGEPFKPQNFLAVFFQLYPEFAQRDNQMQLKQQDADECFQNILQTIQPLTLYENEEGKQKNLIQDLFEIELQSTIENQDIPDEPKKVGIERGRKLMCIIDNQSKPVNTLVEGITVSLEEQMEKISETDQQTHIYKKTQRISKLPSYLLCQMVRFYWKQGVQGKEGVKAKILRNVAFPKILELYDFCTPELQQLLQAGREYEKKKLLEMAAKETDELEQFKKDLEASGKMVPDDTREIYKQFKAKKLQEEIKNHDDQLYRKHGFGLDTGNYELIGVLTHTGREADSGHYMAWVHHSGDDWIWYDDDKTAERKIEHILDLRGGGDWHMENQKLSDIIKMNNYHYLFKFIIVGESNVGKSCLLLQYTEGRFQVGYDATIGVEYGSKEIIYDDKLIKLQLWDTAGQESFRSITRAYYRGSIGCFLVYDITRRITFDRIQAWVKDVRQDTNNRIEFLLVGNKCDLKDRKVSYDEGKQLSIQLGCEFQETSAKTGENVEFIFESLTKKIYDNIKSNKIDPHDPNHGIKIGKIGENEKITEIPKQKQRSICC